MFEGTQRSAERERGVSVLLDRFCFMLGFVFLIGVTRFRKLKRRVKYNFLAIRDIIRIFSLNSLKIWKML